MKKTFVLLSLLLCNMVIFSQSKKTIALLNEGIETNNREKINEALQKKARFSDSQLEKLIKSNNLELASLAIQNGASSTSGLIFAVDENNMDAVDIMLSNKAELSYKGLDVLDSVYAVNILKQKKAISFDIDEKNKPITVDDPVLMYNLYSLLKKPVSDSEKFVLYKYKTTNRLFGSKVIIKAVESNNVILCKKLIENGYDLTLPILINDFDPNFSGGFVSSGLITNIMKSNGTIDLQTNVGRIRSDNEGFYNTTVCPSPAVKKSILEFVFKSKNIGIKELILDNYFMKADMFGKLDRNTKATMLYFATESGDIQMVKQLVEKGVEINSLSFNGCSALYCAAKVGNIEIINYLLEKGALINFQNSSGETALMAASRFKQVETASLLLEKGADKTIKSKSGNTASDLAKDHNSDSKENPQKKINGN